MDSIIVTAQRRPSAEMLSAVAVVASQEDLGDLKLYRVPIPVTVAANGQKQVALLVKDRVPFRTIYRVRVFPGDEGAAMMPERSEEHTCETTSTMRITSAVFCL